MLNKNTNPNREIEMKIQARAMKKAWELKRSSEDSFSVCLKKAWELVKNKNKKSSFISLGARNKGHNLYVLSGEKVINLLKIEDDFDVEITDFIFCDEKKEVIADFPGYLEDLIQPIISKLNALI